MTRDVKSFALQLISEINKRGKQLLDDLHYFCKARTTEFQNKGQEIDGITCKLDYSLKFISHALDKGSNEVLLYSKRNIIKQLRSAIMTQCSVPTPCQKNDIQFHCDRNFGSTSIPRQGMLVVDNINYSGLSRDRQHQFIMTGQADNAQRVGVSPMHQHQSFQECLQSQQQSGFMSRQGTSQLTSPQAGSMKQGSKRLEFTMNAWLLLYSCLLKKIVAAVQ